MKFYLKMIFAEMKSKALQSCAGFYGQLRVWVITLNSLQLGEVGVWILIISHIGVNVLGFLIYQGQIWRSCWGDLHEVNTHINSISELCVWEMELPEIILSHRYSLTGKFAGTTGLSTPIPIICSIDSQRRMGLLDSNQKISVVSGVGIKAIATWSGRSIKIAYHKTI